MQYLLMDTSASLTQSTMVCRWRCTACVSTLTTFARVFRATYRMLLSLFPRNLQGPMDIRDLLLLIFRLPASVDKLLTSEEKEYTQRCVGQKDYTAERHYMEQELLEL